MYPKKPLVDYFGNLIEVGDAYFYGSPPTAGIVTKINKTTIEISYPTKRWSSVLDSWIEVDTQDTMKCKSPRKGVCLDKKGFV